MVNRIVREDEGKVNHSKRVDAKLSVCHHVQTDWANKTKQKLDIRFKSYKSLENGRDKRHVLYMYF